MNSDPSKLDLLHWLPLETRCRRYATTPAQSFYLITSNPPSVGQDLMIGASSRSRPTTIITIIVFREWNALPPDLVQTDSSVPVYRYSQPRRQHIFHFLTWGLRTTMRMNLFRHYHPTRIRTQKYPSRIRTFM